MTRATLLALAERVEAATGADRALAKDIYRALFDAPELGHPNGYGWREDDSGWWLATGEDARTPPKTIYPPKWLTSLDAAMSLVPSGCLFMVRTLWDDGKTSGYAVIQHYEPTETQGLRYDGESVAIAATPALALTAAALRCYCMEYDR